MALPLTLDRAPAAGAVQVEQVIITFKTHFDIGYTDLASNVVQRYRTTMIDQALRVCDQNRDLPAAQQFVWMIPGWPMHQITEDWPGQTPQRREQVRRAFQERRFAVHALPFTTHTELLEPEDLVRGLGFSSRLAREAGLSLPTDAKMTDVPCHSWILPTLLRHAGVEFLHLGCNAASSSPRVPRLFWWEGPDGSRLLTMYTAESYGTGLVPPKDWPYKTWLALVHTGDNHGPPSPEEIKKLLEEAKSVLPGVKVRIGRLSDFAEGILAEKAALPVVRGDMPDTLIHGPMCDPAGARLARNTRPAIAAAESLNTLLRAWKLDAPAAAPVIARAYEHSLLYGEHTWGGALYWVTKYTAGGVNFFYGEAWERDRIKGRFDRLEASWDEHTAYIKQAQEWIAPLARQQLQRLANEVRHAGPRIIVFNPLPWKRDGLVQFKPGGGAIEAVIAADGQETAAVEREGGELRFVARRMPPGGYRTYVPVKAEAGPSRFRFDPDTATLENDVFKARFPDHGRMVSLVDKRTGRELVDTSSEHWFGQYLYERFTSNQVHAYVKAYVKIDAAWAINELGKPNMPPADLGTAPRQDFSRLASWSATAPTKDAPAFSVTLRASPETNGTHRASLKLRLYADLPFVDLEMEVLNKPADPWPEAGWLCLPLNVRAPEFRLGRQASIVDPAKDIVPGANHHLYALNTGVALFDSEGQGVGVCPLDNPLVSLDQPGCWKYSLDFVPRKPAVYVNLFNNQWTTNFRLWNEGTWTARVRLWSFNRFSADSGLITPSLEARFPLQAAFADGAAGALPLAQRGVAVSRPGVLMTALGANPDGAGTLLRLWELAGQSGPCRVELPSGLAAATVRPMNLRGQIEGQPIPVRNGEFTVGLRAFAPMSFVLEP